MKFQECDFNGKSEDYIREIIQYNCEQFINVKDLFEKVESFCEKNNFDLEEVAVTYDDRGLGVTGKIK